MEKQAFSFYPFSGFCYLDILATFNYSCYTGFKKKIMDTSKIITLIQMVVGVVMCVAILIQNKGVGLSQTFGGSEGNVYQTKRGAEKIIFRATIALVVFFIGLGIANLFVE